MATLTVLGSQGQPLAGAIVKIHAKSGLFVPPYDDTVTTDIQGQVKVRPAKGLGSNGRQYRIDVNWRPLSAGMFDPTYKASVQWEAYWGDFRPARKEIVLATTRKPKDKQRLQLGSFGPILFIGGALATIVFIGPPIIDTVKDIYLMR